MRSGSKRVTSAIAGPRAPLTRYAPTVPCASMRAHSDIKKILMLEKHDDFMRGPPSCSMLPAFRFDSRGFFTCIFPLTFTSSHAARRGSETHAACRLHGARWPDDCFRFLCRTSLRLRQPPGRLHSLRPLGRRGSSRSLRCVIMFWIFFSLPPPSSPCAFSHTWRAGKRTSEQLHGAPALVFTSVLAPPSTRTTM